MSNQSSIEFASKVPRLVATLGPKSFDTATALVQAGATALRLNASHMSPDEVGRHCQALRTTLPKTRCIIDLQGKKMRIGAIRPRQLELDARVVLTSDPNDQDGIFVPHTELFEQVVDGECLSFDDGRIEVRIVGHATTRIVARVQRAGLLRPRKGLNRVEHPIELNELTTADQLAISRCLSVEGVEFAVSFATDGAEAAWVRSRAPGRRVILKIERAEAIANLNLLAHTADELWICRGDLGAQLGLCNMARQVARVDPRKHSVPVLMAGQVLEHLTQHDTPTRSEVCHLTDLILRGYAGIVLSDETAIGISPASATRWAAQLMHDAIAPSGEPREMALSGPA